jgi:hypothetical protein
VSPIIMPDPKDLGLAVSQAQCSVGLINMADPKDFGIAISQAQVAWVR